DLEQYPWPWQSDREWWVQNDRYSERNQATDWERQEPRSEIKTNQKCLEGERAGKRHVSGTIPFVAVRFDMPSKQSIGHRVEPIAEVSDHWV
ncbi:MAG: hypothetical protein KGY43_05725, partial [Halodesulfurarchaeum sp.]|nr:hypothetical protein [Halodesulfurarchaeum sp.]